MILTSLYSGSVKALNDKGKATYGDPVSLSTLLRKSQIEEMVKEIDGALK